MRIILLATLLLTTPAAAQFDRATPEKSDKIQDRHPAYFRDLIEERRVTTEAIHSFEQRWEPVQELIRQQAARRAMAEPDAPAASLGALVPAPRAKKLAEDTRPAQALCVRHNLRTVWSGESWRCRK